MSAALDLLVYLNWSKNEAESQNTVLFDLFSAKDKINVPFVLNRALLKGATHMGVPFQPLLVGIGSLLGVNNSSVVE
jgi:hypothetical protein